MKNLVLSKMVFLGVALAAFANAAVTVNKVDGWLESAFIEWAPVSGASSYTVLADGKAIDQQLIRSYGSHVRADVPGLKAGSHTLQVKASNGEISETKSVTVKAYDRAGFAFANGRVPGAYKADGTPKDGAVILYVTEKTKDEVSLNVTGATANPCVGLQTILDGFKKGKDTRPLIIRLVGEVTDPSYTDKGDIVIENNKNANSYITLEGIGNDATVNGWGIRVKNAQNVEIRNLGIMNVNSSEGDNIGLQQDNEYVWVHNNDFFYGHAGSDSDQAKGDGALDCKKSTYITFSYNHFWDNGKSNLLGLSEGTTEGLFITYHHNWYDHSDSRHPRVRFYSAHVYNNYYDGNAKYGIGSTLGSSVFAEANYFRNCKYPMLTSMQGSDVYGTGSKRDPANLGTFSKEAGGSIKAFNNYIEGGHFVAYGANDSRMNTKVDFDAYVVTSRTQEMPASVTSYDGANKHNNFDLNLPYSYVVDAPAAAKTNVTTYAGRVQGGDFKWTFNNSVDDESSAVNQALKNALVAYKGKVQAIQGEGNMTPVIGSSSSGIVSSSSSKPASSSSSKPASSSSVSSSSSKPASSSSVSASGASLTKHGAGSATQTVPQGKAITEFYYTVAGATGATVTGLPEGVKGTLKGSDFYISGTVSANAKIGEYKFTVTTTGAAKNVSKTGTITVTANASQESSSSVGSAESSSSTEKDESSSSSGNASAESSSSVENVPSSSSETNVNSSSSSNAPAESSSSVEIPGSENSSSSEKDNTPVFAQDFAKNAMHYEACRLVINVQNLQRVTVMGVTGKVVYAGNANVVNMKTFPAGVYIVQVKTKTRMFQTKIKN